MAKHLTESNVKAICGLMDGWRGTLTWEGLVAAVEALTGERYSRQALNAHAEILLAYKVRRNLLRDERPEQVGATVEAQATKDRLARLEAENVRLAAENNRLLGVFATWAYNASLHGMDKEQLDHPLPATDRDRTRVPHLQTRKRS